MARPLPTTALPNWRRYPIGVEVAPDGGSVHARVWAPERKRVELVIDAGSAHELERDESGYFAGLIADVTAGARYRFRLDGGDAYPDPASRFQPEGPHGPSQVVDGTRFQWTDAGWPGVSATGQVIYELHVGTFTTAGTLRGVMQRLPELVDVGVTVIELMPLADFPGRFGWGYDGVNFFAPNRLYGTPDDLRALVDAAHALQLGVVLDVVYNHLGPDGNYLQQFSPYYFGSKATEWGEALNFDEAHSEPVREFVLTNAAYWIEEFHLDGLRLDATQQIFDESEANIVAEIVRAVRHSALGSRHSALSGAARPSAERREPSTRATIVIAENEPQDTRLVREFGVDTLWNDDFHHSARVALTGRNEAYLSGYRGSAQELVSAAKYGFLYQGQWYAWQKQRRGTPTFDLGPTCFVNYLQNHDQVANSAAGARMQTTSSPGRARALTALLLLLPQTPMLFQGQEWGTTTPFLYFADHEPTLATQVQLGRTKFLAQFPSLNTDDGAANLSDPADSSTFVRCKLDWTERKRNSAWLALHRDLLKLRREDPVISHPRARALDGAVFSDDAFVIRLFGDADGDRLLAVNLGTRIHLDPAAEPLLAPPRGHRWQTTLSTDRPRYGGWGTPDVETATDGWWLPAECAVLLSPAAHATTAR